MYMRLFLPVIVGMLIATATSSAQDAEREGRVARVLREKVRIDEATFEHFVKTGELPVATVGERSLIDPHLLERDAPVTPDNTVESEVHAAINPIDSSNIIVSPIRQYGAAIECPVYYTRDFAESWRKSSFRTTPRLGGTMVGGGDPVLAYDADGVAYMTWLSFEARQGSLNIDARMYWASSSDGGETWRRRTSDVVAERQTSFAGTGGVVDKQWMATDRSGSPWRNSLYVAYYDVPSRGESRIVVTHLRTGDTIFPEGVVVSTSDFADLQFADVDVDALGVVHVSFFGTKGSGVWSLYHVRSTDGGATFSPPVTITPVFIPNFTSAAGSGTLTGIDADRLYPSPHLAVDRSSTSTGGNLYVVWSGLGTNSDRGDGFDVYMVRSTDGGSTWSTPRVVNGDERGRERHQFYPSITLSPSGVLVLSWYDRRDDSLHNQTRYMTAWSRDGGETFEAEVAASSVPTSFSTVGQRNSNFGIGEYTQVVATDHHAVPVWTDGRTNNGSLKVFAAVIPMTVASVGPERISSLDAGIALHDLLVDRSRLRLRCSAHRTVEGVLELVDLTGNVVARLERLIAEGGNEIEIPREELAAGSYLLRLTTPGGSVATKVVLD